MTDMTSADGPARTAAQARPSGGRASAGLRILVGALTVVAGGAVMAWPGRSLAVLSMIIGVVLLGTAVMELWTAITTRGGKAGPRVLGVLVGLLLLVAGVLCLRQSVLTITLLTLVLGLAWLVAGVVEIYRAFTGENDRIVSAFSGIVGVLAGIVVLVYPLVSALAAVWVIGGGLVVVGVVAIVRGFRARRRGAA
jgi:uncharacterized membrane protein HdeD (DUF308 family)